MTGMPFSEPQQGISELHSSEWSDIPTLADNHRVDVRDAVLLALNLWGLSSHRDAGRVRVEVTLDLGTEEELEWHLILPTGRPSPFAITGDELCLNGQRLGRVREVEHDDAQLGYVRGNGSALTLNTNRRSTCTGCVFCPNTLADSSDPRAVSDTERLRGFIEFLCLREDWHGLDDVEQVNISTSCFGTAERAVEHLALVREVLAGFGFEGRLGILSSVIRTEEDFRHMRSAAGSSAIFLTLECLERRNLILKDSKANLTLLEAVDLLAAARSNGVDTGVTLVIGLDDPRAVAAWLSTAAVHLTEFPNLQVFQSHSPFMDVFRHPGAGTLSFLLYARGLLEKANLPGEPVHWQNYRPLWYHHFGDIALR